ncbi:MAG: phasin family protein [Microvirga sp.]
MPTMPKTSAISDTLRSAREFALSGDNNQALAKAAESWFAATTESQREMMGFMSERLEKDSEAIREMMACRNPADVMAIQSRWIEETLRDYNAEMTKLMTIYTKSVKGGGHTGG